MSSKMSAGIVMATRLEAAPFLEKTFRENLEKKPFPVFAGEDGHCIISGIGKAAAAMATVYLVEKYAPDYILNFGAAGALKEGFHVGDILQIDRVWEYDRPHLISKKERFFRGELRGDFPAARLATGDVPVLDSQERERLGREAELVDMEGAGVLQAASLYKMPVSLFKIVSDTPEHDTDGEIIENIKSIRDLLFRFYNENLLPVQR